MNLILTFLFGATAAFVGLIPPGMLNMTAVKISIAKGKREAEYYALGAAVTVIIQASLALVITSFLKDNQQFFIYVKEIGSVIFILLSVFFIRKGFSERKENYESKQRIKNNFVIGFVLSLFNMFAIPFYSATSTALNINGYLTFNKISVTLFVIGAAVGTFLLLYLYIFMAQRISHRIQAITKNINFILGVLTGILGIVTFFNL